MPLGPHCACQCKAEEACRDPTTPRIRRRPGRTAGAVYANAFHIAAPVAGDTAVARDRGCCTVLSRGALHRVTSRYSGEAAAAFGLPRPGTSEPGCTRNRVYFR